MMYTYGSTSTRWRISSVTKKPRTDSSTKRSCKRSGQAPLLRAWRTTTAGERQLMVSVVIDLREHA